jgi:hypothetical protein
MINKRSECHGSLTKIALCGALAMSLVACGTNSTPGGGTGGTGAPPAGGTGGTGGSTGNEVVPLPMVVTNYYTNQGWFADPIVAASFTTGSMTIKQADSSTGPCAARDNTARGKCTEVVYTPPPGVAPGVPGFVGVYFLTTLTMAHPELTPPAMAGEANWGSEPGKNVAPGATQISFLAASAPAGLTVIFKAGVMGKDSFTMGDTPQNLTANWQKFTLPLAGMSYGTSLVGAFAWVLTDTARAARFYLDGIVWEK